MYGLTIPVICASYDVVVVGGGAAGMMAAGTAASRGKRVLLIERNEKPGKKIYITGKGRCNVTNASDLNAYMRNIPTNPRFLYSALSRFFNNDLIALLDDMGVPTKIERGNRVFPASDKSSDIIKGLYRYVEQNGADVWFNTRVKDIMAENNAVKGVELYDGRLVEATSVILATGGLSYPTTGSTGDGYTMAERLGHTIKPLMPSLVPLDIVEDWVKSLQGLSLKNVKLSAYAGGKRFFEEQGEMLFTHFGISGPLVLTLSRYMLDHNVTDIEIVLDLKPALTLQQLDERIRRDFSKYNNKQFKNSLGDLLPQKLIPVIVELSHIEQDKPVNQITKEERRNLVEMLKELKMHVLGLRSFKEAVITHGGVDVREIDPKTMESKLVKGLYFAGEIIDVDALTGGYNLQIAFSTGYLAGASC
ncbi:HI0933 family protein [Mahella australiensis 50-1 BON]|uniref:HI0933 family protein n=1 Tax=Mahella australiensis (strain DSM 15567 / CIP 107919 / 50-1 BON) TaxID=697281 RepID=F4A2A3_MAHA5|nr:NAD(P)/FAD-dependent oxidoreductase [Mahella australiensis]AEE96150.1 HI0933 family protein [Mahella australiensis 50-1 BON]